MRLRHKPWAKNLLAAHPEFVVMNPEDAKGNWEKRFKLAQPIHLEIGAGKGRFAIDMAKAHPNINFIALEVQPSVIVTALQQQFDLGLENLLLLVGNAINLPDYFDSAEIDRIYLNFSDPWPKKRHAKRRLTSPNFLPLYQKILSIKGDIHFKTDNQGLFEYSLSSMANYGMLLNNISLDLHQSGWPENIMTEYEEKFSAKGHRIYRLEAKFRTDV